MLEWDKSTGTSIIVEKGPFILTGSGQLNVKEGISRIGYNRDIQFTTTNKDATDERIRLADFNLAWLTADNITSADAPEFFEEETWELLQLGLAIISIGLAGLSLPCCFLVCQRYYNRHHGDENEDNEYEEREMSIIKPKLNRLNTKGGKTKRLRFKKNNKETKEAVKKFLEEFVPKASAPGKLSLIHI